MNTRKEGVLLVANWDSATGYAWWLMESYWGVLAHAYAPFCDVFLAYPTISVIPAVISNSPAKCVSVDFTKSKIMALWRQLQFLIKHRIRTIYFSDQPFYHWRYFLFRFFGVRTIIVHDHTPGMRTGGSKLKRSIKKMMYSVPGLSADSIFGATQFVTDRAIRVAMVPKARCHTVQNGIPSIDADTVADVRSLFQIPESRKIIVSVGRATEYKGIHLVIDALAELIRKRQHRDIHFLYCGDGPDLAKFKQRAMALGVEDHVTFAGRRTDIGELLRGCDFSIQPSSGEVGYSLSILEYMRAGLPVVVPDDPSVCQATEHGVTGLLYHRGNVTAIANAIEQLLDNPESARIMGERARLMQASEFSLEKSHQALLKSIRLSDPLCYTFVAEERS